MRTGDFIAVLRRLPRARALKEIAGWKRAEELWPQPMTPEEKIELARFEGELRKP